MFLNCGVEKTLASPSGCMEIQPVHPRGNQPWIFTGRTDAEAETPIPGPPDVKNWLIWKDPDAGKDWRLEENGMTEDEMVGWYHWLNGHEFEQALGVARETWHAEVHGVTKSQTWLSNKTELTWINFFTYNYAKLYFNNIKIYQKVVFSFSLRKQPEIKMRWIIKIDVNRFMA